MLSRIIEIIFYIFGIIFIYGAFEFGYTGLFQVLIFLLGIFAIFRGYVERKYFSNMY